MDLWARLTYITRTFRVGFAPRPMRSIVRNNIGCHGAIRGEAVAGKGAAGPWGQGPSGPPGRGGGNQPPDLEELIRKSQERLRQILPGGGGTSGGFGRGQWLAVLALVLLGWLYMSANTIKPDESGLVLSLGSYHRTVGPGLHFAIWPVETHRDGSASRPKTRRRFRRRGQGEGLMLSGDQNIVDIGSPSCGRSGIREEYLFNVADQEKLVTRGGRKRHARDRRPHAGGGNPHHRPPGRPGQVTDIIQTTLDSYRSGILGHRRPARKGRAAAAKCADAFDEVQRAEQDEDRSISEADQYSNQKLGQARGEASQIVEDAKGYKTRVVAEAQGEAQRFLSRLRRICQGAGRDAQAAVPRDDGGRARRNPTR